MKTFLLLFMDLLSWTFFSWTTLFFSFFSFNFFFLFSKAVSSEAATHQRERTSLLTRVEDLQLRLAAAQSDIEMGTRDREDLMVRECSYK